jgi:energy-coupling factor transporter ATP-binding protein EcfA2
MSTSSPALRQQIEELERNLRLLEEQETKFVLSTDIPLQLIREKATIQTRLAELQERLDQLRTIECPYRGLQYFEEQHTANYFGREAMVQKLVQKVGECNFIAIVGPSGSGKSSLVRAGLIPALKVQGSLSTSPSWEFDILRPGADPLLALATPLIRRLSPELSPVDRLTENRKLADRLRRNELPIGDVLSPLLAQSTMLMLVFDQFEEAFTLCEDDTTRQRFLTVLLEAATVPRCKVLFTLRADFFGRVLEREDFSQMVDFGLVNIIPMTLEERRAAIEQPALQTGRRFGDGLVERIMADLEQEPGQLPLLEFALTELWERQTAEGVLTHSAYTEIGEVAGAIARRADETLQSLGRDEQEQARTIFTRLVRVTLPEEGAEDTRQRFALTELDPSLRSLIQRLADARLLVTSRDEQTNMEMVEVAHEALIRNWQELQSWLNRDREFLLWRQRLRGLIETWQASSKDESALLRGALLNESERWLDTRKDELNQREQAFIIASQYAAENARQREAVRSAELATERARANEQTKSSRRFRQSAIALAMLSLLAIVASGIAYSQWQAAEFFRSEAEERANISFLAQGQAEQQAEIAMTERARADIERSQAIQARETAVSAEIASEELRRLIRADQLSQMALLLDKDALPQRALLLSIEAIRMISSPLPSTLQIFYTLPSQIGGKYIDNDNAFPTDLIFSPDGQWLASGSGDRTIRLWQAAQPTADPIVLRGHEGGVTSVAFSPDGQWLASGSGDRTIRLWLVKIDARTALACHLAGRNLTQEEWNQYFPDEEYRRTCPQWPARE